MKISVVIDVLLCVALLLLVLHIGGVDLSRTAGDIVRALDTMPSTPQFGDGMWFADVMDAAAAYGSKGGW